MPQATVNPSGAAAPFDPSTAIAHFQFIEDASAFIQGKHAVVPRAHAVAFFASEREPESRIYERVAENLAELAHAPALGRANIGQDTEGCTVHLVPAAPLRAPNGTDVATVLTHRFRLPASPAADGVRDEWLALQARYGFRDPDAPSNDEMWQNILEESAMVLHRFLEAGALPRATELTEATLEPLLASSHAVGLLLLPKNSARANAVLGYHTRRLRELAAAYPTVECESLDPPAANSAEALWVPLPRCAPLLPNASLRFAYAALDAAFAAKLAKRLQLDADEALPVADGTTRFALLRRRRHGSAAAAGADELPGMMAPGVGWRASLMPPPAAGADGKGAWLPGVAGWIEGVRWT